jgi:hypothetical protein
MRLARRQRMHVHPHPSRPRIAYALTCGRALARRTRRRSTDRGVCRRKQQPSTLKAFAKPDRK